MVRKFLRKKHGRYIFAVILIILAATALLDHFNVINKPVEENTVTAEGDAYVTFVDVGQGDCTLVQSGDKTMLIDTGDIDKNNTAINYLKEAGAVKLDYFIITHPDSDHMGEAAEIIESFEIGTVIMPELPDDLVPTTATFESFLDAMDEKGLKLHKAADESFELGELLVQTYASQGDYSNTNNYSTLVRITHGENSFLITGDCEKQAEKAFLERGVSLESDVLKVGHHGSKTSTTDDFLAAVNPDYAVISCGLDNSYGHPSDEVVERLNTYGCEVYITVSSGTIKFTSDGQKLSVSCEKE